MRALALSSIAPFLGQRVPIRGPARLLHSSYQKASLQNGVRVGTVATKNGDRFYADLASSLEWELWAFGAYEPEIGALLARLIDPGDLCIDVGANVGIHTVRMATLVGPRGLVLAIEADAHVARRLEANLRLNALQNVQVVNAAASTSTGKWVGFYPAMAEDRNKGRGSVLPHDYLSEHAASVPTVALDDIANRRVRVVKIDVEGYEAQVISGATHLVERDRPAIVFEHNAKLASTAAMAPTDYLRTLDYRFLVVRGVRNRVTGRTRLCLIPMRQLPAGNANLLAICGDEVPPFLRQVEQARSWWRYT